MRYFDFRARAADRRSPLADVQDSSGGVVASANIADQRGPESNVGRTVDQEGFTVFLICASEIIAEFPLQGS
jgi:hypothetical protein